MTPTDVQEQQGGSAPGDVSTPFSCAICPRTTRDGCLVCTAQRGGVQFQQPLPDGLAIALLDVLAFDAAVTPMAARPLAPAPHTWTEPAGERSSTQLLSARRYTLSKRRS